MRKNVFPNYINSPRIILFWEADELKFIAIVLVFSFSLLFLSNMPTPVIVGAEAIIVPVSLRAYRNLTKEAPPGWLRHFLYSIGIMPAVDKIFLKRNGMDPEKDVIPPSFITVFEDQ